MQKAIATLFAIGILASQSAHAIAIYDAVVSYQADYALMIDEFGNIYGQGQTYIYRDGPRQFELSVTAESLVQSSNTDATVILGGGLPSADFNGTVQSSVLEIGDSFAAASHASGTTLEGPSGGPVEFLSAESSVDVLTRLTISNPTDRGMTTYFDMVLAWALEITTDPLSSIGVDYVNGGVDTAVAAVNAAMVGTDGAVAALDSTTYPTAGTYSASGTLEPLSVLVAFSVAAGETKTFDLALLGTSGSAFTERTFGAPTPTTTVPEPSTFWLLSSVLGLLSVAHSRRRRARNT